MHDTAARPSGCVLAARTFHETYLPPPPAPLLEPLPLIPDDPLPPVGPVEDPGLPELVPGFPVLDPVFPPGPVSIPIPGLAFSGNVPPAPLPGSVLPLGIPAPVFPLPIPPNDPLPVPPGAAVSWATTMESEFRSPDAVLAADAEPTRQVIPTVATPTESICRSFMDIPLC